MLPCNIPINHFFPLTPQILKQTAFHCSHIKAHEFSGSSFFVSAIQQMFAAISIHMHFCQEIYQHIKVKKKDLKGNFV